MGDDACSPFRAKRREEVCKAHAQPAGELSDRGNPDVPFTPFDAADVVPVQVRALGEFLLRNIQRLSQFADAPPDRCRQIDLHGLIVLA